MALVGRRDRSAPHRRGPFILAGCPGARLAHQLWRTPSDRASRTKPASRELRVRTHHGCGRGSDASSDGRHDRVPADLASPRHVSVPPGTSRQRDARSAVSPANSCATSMAGMAVSEQH
jgi:hypothetical protein